MLPSNVITVFANTGMELPETLDFVRDCGERLNLPIVWLEYFFDPDGVRTGPNYKHHFRVVDHATASRKGEPYEMMIKANKIIPNIATRKCTSELKVRTVERYCTRVLGWPKGSIRNILGLRYDEPAPLAGENAAGLQL